jgi:hypothetical protein
MTKGALIGKDAREQHRTYTLELAPAEAERLKEEARLHSVSPESLLKKIVRAGLAKL